MYRYVIPLNDKKAEANLKAKKKVSSRMIFLNDIRPINEENPKTIFWKIFVNLKELQESMNYFITLSTKYQRRYPIELFLYLNKRPQKEKYNLKNLIMIFWYTITIESTQLRRWLYFRAMMNYENKDLINKI